MHSRALSSLVLVATLACANARAPLPAPTHYASRVPAAAPDRSLTAIEYVAAGFPATDRTWALDDFGRAHESLAKLATRDPLALPRRGSALSGEVFARMTDRANFAILGDRSYPVSARSPLALAGVQALTGIAKIYLAAHLSGNGSLGAELVDLQCVMFHATRLIPDLAREMPVPEPGSPERAKFDEGFGQVRSGLANVVRGALSTLAEPYSEPDRERFAACVADEMPPSIQHLTAQAQAEARQRMRRTIEAERSSAVRRELLRLDAMTSLAR